MGQMGRIGRRQRLGHRAVPECGIRGRPSGPSLPESVRCPRFSVRSSDMLKHGHHTLRLVELCFGCRRSLPWSAAVLCRFQDGINDSVTYVSPISGGSKAVEDYRTPRRYRDLCGLSGFSHVWSQAFHLVSPGCTYTTLKHDKTRYF